MLVIVRSPDPTSIVPLRQCQGDWAWWHAAALKFLKETQNVLGVLAESGEVTAEKCSSRAHSVKTAAEMLGMGALSTSAYEMERGALAAVSVQGADAELGMLQRIGVVMDNAAALLEVLEHPAMAEDPVRALAAAEGYFDVLLAQHRVAEERAHENHAAAAVTMMPQTSTGSWFPALAAAGGASSSFEEGSGGSSDVSFMSAASAASRAWDLSDEGMRRSTEPGWGGAARDAFFEQEPPRARNRRSSSSLSAHHAEQHGRLFARAHRASWSSEQASPAAPPPAAAWSGGVPSPTAAALFRRSVSHATFWGARPEEEGSPAAAPAAEEPALKAVGVLGAESVARALTGLVVAKATGATVVFFESPEDLHLGAGVRQGTGGIYGRSADIGVVVVCLGPGLALDSLDDLPLSTASGARRGFVFVGELEGNLEDEILESDFCEIVRIPARSTEIALRIRKLVRAAAGQHHRRSETGGEC